MVKEDMLGVVNRRNLGRNPSFNIDLNENQAITSSCWLYSVCVQGRRSQSRFGSFLGLVLLAFIPLLFRDIPLPPSERHDN